MKTLPGDKVEECEKNQKMRRDTFIGICQGLMTVMSEHLAHYDQEGVVTDYETIWFLYNLPLPQAAVHTGQ